MQLENRAGTLMARPIWTGTISFGLLNVPVQLYSGERSVDLHFRLLDSRDKSPIRYERVSAETGKEVAWKDIVKAFEYRKGSYAVIDEKQLRKAAPEATRTIDIEAFVERESIQASFYEKPYILVPAKKAEKPYVLLRETLKKTGKVGIAKVVIRTRQYLAMLLPDDAALMLNLLRFPQEIVAHDEFKLPEGKATDFKISTREIDMAAQLIESMAVEWNPEDYKDDFRDKLAAIVEKMVASQSDDLVSEPEDEDEPATGKSDAAQPDFMALLKQSLAAKGQSKKTGRASRSPTRRRSTHTKTAPRKTATSKRKK
jgi:DNA end-binding protein Ku